MNNVNFAMFAGEYSLPVSSTSTSSF